MDMARQLASETETELDDFIVGAHEAHLWLAQGNLDAAVQWATQHRPWVISMPEVPTRQIGGHEPYYLHEIEQMTLARIHLAQGQANQALAVLAPVLEKVEQLQWIGIVIEILALQALAFEAQGNDEEALNALRRALRLAEPEGYVRVSSMKARRWLVCFTKLRRVDHTGPCRQIACRILTSAPPSHGHRPIWLNC
jgi:LuxR family maltose regulon positive regulatory protein